MLNLKVTISTGPTVADDVYATFTFDGYTWVDDEGSPADQRYPRALLQVASALANDQYADPEVKEAAATAYAAGLRNKAHQAI